MLRRFQGWMLGTLAALPIVAALPSAILAQAIPSTQTTGKEIVNIFPAAPRELRQNLSRAQSAVEEERFSDAVAELGQILNSPQSDDYFLGTPGQGDALPSLKMQALQMLGTMPAKGRQMYELQFGAEAKAQLDSALNEGDLQKLTDVARRYFHTKAGYEATLILGRMQLDQGRPLGAALILKRITDSPVAAAQYDPELSVLLATCWVHARMPEKATETLVALKNRLPQAKVQLLDKEATLFDRDDQALAWLEKIVGGGRTPLSLAATQWVMFRGNESRNAASGGGVPLVNYRWNSMTVYNPADEQRVKSLARGLRDRGEPNICCLQPLVVHDSVIFRHPESSKLIGVSLKNGKVEWVFPPFDDSPAAKAAQSATPKTGTVNLRDQELRQRIWEDNAFGQISSDGRQAYVIDDLGYAAMVNMGVPRVIIGPGGRPILNNAWSKPNNLLVALDLKKQGYQMWAVGGTTGDSPALAGAFFLGPPLPLGDQLYVLAEMNSEIRLVCLDAATGDLVWKQQLAVVEDNQQIVLDRVRRLAGASPSFADGVLVCPTSAGAVVAVDLSTRSLRWGYPYARWDAANRTVNGFAISSRPATPNQGSWIDGTATISDGAVIVTPVESAELHCLDLLTGKARWPAQARDDMLFVACVHKGNIVLVGKSSAKAIKLSDGTPAWKAPLALDNEAPTGRGYYTDKYYYLPVSGQQLLKIDLDEGKIVSKAKTEVDLGNVVCYKDQLISQSPQYVASFYLSEPLVARIEDTLRKNPDDAEALTLKGQVQLQEGKRTEALDTLRRAVQKNPENSGAKSLLVKVMLALLRDDFAANFALAEELDKLVTDPAQQREILRFRALGLAKAGKPWESFEALIALADRSPDSGSSAGSGQAALEAVDRDLAVRSDRWLQGQLAVLYRAADEATREKMTALVQKRLDPALTVGSTASLREFISLYGFHPLASKAKLALAEKLIAVDQLLEAELLAGDLLASPDRAMAGGARAALASVYEKARRFDLAARYYVELREQYADVPCQRGLTGVQLADRAAEVAAVAPFLTGSLWPAGRVEVTAEAAGNLNNSQLPFQRLLYGIQLTQFQGAALRGLRASFDPNQYQIVVRDDLGRTLATGSLRGSDGQIRRYFSIPYNLLSGKVNGHLVVVSLGGEVVAVDSLRADKGSADGLLWRQDAVELDPATQRSLYPQQRQSSNPLVGNKMITYDPTGRLNFYTGPVQSLGVTFQKGRQLLCVEPTSGHTIWERSQIPAGAEVFGDEEFLFVADPNADEALVLSPIDGTLLGRRKVDRAERRWTTLGRNVLAWEQTGSVVKVRLYDAWTGSELWTRQVPLGSRGTLVDGEEVAILEPSGQFTVVALTTGQVRFAVPLEAERTLSWIGVQRSQGQYVLIASQETTESPPGQLIQPITTAGSQQTKVHGRIYAFNRRTGKTQWQVPAFVAHHYLPQEQPPETPLLYFVRNVTTAGGGSKWGTSVLCLDKRDGRIVWENDGAASQTNHCELVGDPLKKTVSMTLWSPPRSSSITFRLTDLPAPPQPPAQTGSLSSASVGQVVGVVDRSIDAAFDLLRRGINPAQAIPVGPAGNVVPAAAPAPPR